MVYDNPPSYDYATQDDEPANSGGPRDAARTQDAKGLPPHAAKGPPPPAAKASPPLALRAGPSYGAAPAVHHYVHPLTGEHVASVLPPDHPEMQCLQEGRHVQRTRFGLLGVLAAIVWFPLGIGLCLLDRRVRCERCGYVIEDGILCG